MRVTNLTRNYHKLTLLIGKDKHLFRKLLNGGIYSPILFIVPINSNSILSCEGFSIEHHRFVMFDDEYYLIFRKKRLRFHSAHNSNFRTYYLINTAKCGNMYLNRIFSINLDSIPVINLRY